MLISDVELYANGQLEPLTVVTATPQTNCCWLISNLRERFAGARVVELGVGAPVLADADGATLIVTHAELPILAAATTADELVSQLVALATKNRVIVCLTLSDALTDRYYETGRQLARLAMRLLYEASLVLQVQPLKTGRARDLTGRLVVARGPKCASGLVERELFFHVGMKGDVELRE